MYPYNFSYHPALNQYLLHPTHQKFTSQQALTPHPQSQHQPALPPASPVTDNESSGISSPCSAASTTSTRILRPRLPIMCNETALSQLHGRPQIRTLTNVSIPIPASTEEESPTDSDHPEEGLPTTEAKAVSLREVSLVSTPSATAEADPPHQDRSPASAASRQQVSSDDSSTLKSTPVKSMDQ